ncbi:MAG: NAD(P)-dependent alcohol dehydrogenase [Candidatus Saccharimonadales bacterium]
MKNVKARAVFGLNEPFKATTIERREVGPKDVLIEVKYAGICHSDIHHARGEWQEETFPLVPGHEIVGTVAEVGGEVTKYKVGDNVGVGCMVNSCGTCDNCQKGFEQYCLNGNVLTYASVDKYAGGERTQGGYSTHIVVTEGFVVRIPDGIELDKATPLLCAGITTYSPLRHWNAGPGKKVAVVGMGGLGHMAVKLAHAMGAEVTVLSQSLSKKEDGLKLGADHYFATKDAETFEKLKGEFDLIINTVSADMDIDAYLETLKVDGTMVLVGAPSAPQKVKAFSLIPGRKSFAGSTIGGIAETQEMLNFAAEHKIGAEIEVISADEIDKAYERVVASDVRYRFVIDAATI